MAEVDPRQVQAQATLPPAGATDASGNLPTQGANVDATLQTPTAAAPAQQLNLVPPTPPVTATSPNKHLMSWGARILGALAGEEHQYNYSDAGKLVASSVPLTTTQKIGRIIGKLGSGLSAPTPEGGASSISANIGAGMKAAQEKTAGEDVLKRAQAREDFEQQQQTKLRQYDIARLNALTYATHLENEKREKDLNPDYAQNEGLFQAIQDSPELGPHVREISGPQAQQEIEQDKNLHTHVFLPMGLAPVNDENGNPVRSNPADETSAPKMTMRYAVVDGMKDGQVPITPGIAADIQKYGSLSNRISSVSGLKAGDSYALRQLVPVLAEIKAMKKMEQEGWAKPEYAWGKDAKGNPVPVAVNPNLPVGQQGKTKQLDYMPAKLFEDKAKQDLDNATEAKDYATAANLKKQTEMLGLGFGGDPNAIKNYIPPADTRSKSSLDLRKYLADNKQPVPANFETLYSVGHYDQDPETFVRALRKGTNQMPEDMAIAYIRTYINPTYSKADWKAVEKITTDTADLSPSKPGGNLLAFSTATGHIGQIWTAAELLHKWEVGHDADSFQSLRALANRLGVEAGSTPQGTYDAIQAVLVGEIGKVAKSGTPDIPERQDLEKNLNRNLGLPQIASNLKAYAHAMLTKAKETGTSYYSYKGHYPPNLMSDDARKVYQKMGIDTSDVVTGPQITPQIGGGSQSGQPKSLTNIHSDGKTTIGWDGTQWVDQTTNQPYKAAQ